MGARKRALNWKPGMLAGALLLLGLGCALPSVPEAPRMVTVVVTATGEPAGTASEGSPAPKEESARTDTPAPTDTPSNTATPTSTPTITLTSTPSIPMAAADKGVDINCRFGPGPEYAIKSALLQGQTAQIFGRDRWTQWIQIQDPKQPAGNCWVDIDFVTLSVPGESLAELAAPGGIVYAVEVKLLRKNIIHGDCGWPVYCSMVFNVVIKVSGPATIKYVIHASTGWTMAHPDAVLDKYGELRYENLPLTFHQPGDFWVEAYTTSPNGFSHRATGSIQCD